MEQQGTGGRKGSLIRGCRKSGILTISGSSAGTRGTATPTYTPHTPHPHPKRIPLPTQPHPATQLRPVLQHLQAPFPSRPQPRLNATPPSSPPSTPSSPASPRATRRGTTAPSPTGRGTPDTPTSTCNSSPTSRACRSRPRWCMS